MKRKIVILLCLLSCLLVGIVCANGLEIVQALKVQHPILVNNQSVDENLSVLSVDDRIYLPLRATCDILGIDIEWNEQDRLVEITTQQQENPGTFSVGYWGIEGWTPTKPVSYSLTEEVAVVIADDVFSQMNGDAFISNTIVDIEETDDQSCYIISRFLEEEFTAGGSLSVVIRKSDGKILRVEAGE